MKRLILMTILLLACLFAWPDRQLSHADDPVESAHDPIAVEIEMVLTRQASHWNEGDIDGFMETYWKSEDLTFSSGGKTRRGWQETYERYQQRYPTPERMGKLAFSDLEVRPLGDTAVLVLGRWRLEREPDPIGGNFTLVLEKPEGKWLIIHDHTSQLRQETGDRRQ